MESSDDDSDDDKHKSSKKPKKEESKSKNSVKLEGPPTKKAKVTTKTVAKEAVIEDKIEPKKNSAKKTKDIPTK